MVQNRIKNQLLIQAIAFALILIVVNSLVAFAQVSPMAVVPNETDPHISSFNNPHYIWLPATQPRGQLLLFLQGTFGVPRPNFPFLSMASQLGYHVIELAYPNDVAAQQVCPNSSDPDAYIKFRIEIIQGGNASPLIHVEPADSIENRLQKLLYFLCVRQPNMGWNHFLDKSGQIIWHNICVAGQSQGGGHAFVISKIHELARVIMTGSPKDYSHYFHAPARGFDTHTATPLDRYFAFNHIQDNIGACTHAQQMDILQQMGLTRFGTAEAENPTPGYNHAHIIVTDAAVGNDPKMFHNAPLNGNIPTSPQVWLYMLTEPVQ